MRSRRSAREELRHTIECLPRRTRVAMLEGIRANDIIVGAYVDRKGGDHHGTGRKSCTRCEKRSQRIWIFPPYVG